MKRALSQKQQQNLFILITSRFAKISHSSFSTFRSSYCKSSFFKQHICCAISKIPVSPSVQNSVQNGGQEWSQRLMSVSRKIKPKIVNRDSDIFEPASSESNPLEGEDLLDAPESSKRLPSEMRYFDTARIYVKSGDGGNGCVAFRREKKVEFGGPAGGNGGRGGDVWAVVDTNYNSLMSFRKRIHWRAQDGTSGQGKDMFGADGEDLYIPVPRGTVIRRADADEDEPPVAELLQTGEKALIWAGGIGGKGNAAFKGPLNQAPTIAELGEKGKEGWLLLELKVMADVGIIGIPNAGKSTLLSVITSAKPKIANYPFTTLVPNLGVCELDYRATVFADVPGLLEGAHEGYGLGHQFLRHVQRCRALVHVIDGTSPDPVGDWRAINLELELFNPILITKPQIIAYNKMDDTEAEVFWEDVREALIADGLPSEHVFAISAVTGRGVLDLVRGVRRCLDALGPEVLQRETAALNQSRPERHLDSRLDDFTIEVTKNDDGKSTFNVRGRGLERFTQMTNWNYYEAVKRFQRVLEVAGVDAALKNKGVKNGDTIVVSEGEFQWNDDRSESAIFEAWLEDMRSRGQSTVRRTKWPSPF